MKVAVMQPYLFPYLGYFQLMAAVDTFVFLDDVAYIKKGWINRNRLLVNKAEYLFTVPVKGASQNRMIREIETDITEAWKKKFFRTLEEAYAKAPYLQETLTLVHEIFENPSASLSVFISGSFRLLNEKLGITTKLEPSSAAFPCRELRAQDKIVCIARAAGATVYVNPPGGRELYDAELFRRNDLALKFLAPALPEYSQPAAQFVPGLSIIDVLMHNPVPVVQEWLHLYQLNN